MSLIPTLGFAAAALSAAIFCGWRGALPPDPNKGPRMIPWQFLMLLFAALAILLAVHLAALLGLHRSTL